jgi:hypothetical protein
MQPVKQPKNYDQVHQASGFGAFELSQNPVFRELAAEFLGAFTYR